MHQQSNLIINKTICTYKTVLFIFEISFFLYVGYLFLYYCNFIHLSLSCHLYVTITAIFYTILFKLLFKRLNNKIHKQREKYTQRT